MRCRPRVEHAIRNNQTFVTQFKHPGFDIPRSRIPKRKLATYEPGHPSYRPQIRKREEFAEGMRNAQICVFDSSVEKKAIRKYAQAFLSGCVVAADRESTSPGRRLVLIFEILQSRPSKKKHLGTSLFNFDRMRLYLKSTASFQKL